MIGRILKTLILLLLEAVIIWWLVRRPLAQLHQDIISRPIIWETPQK